MPEDNPTILLSMRLQHRVQLLPDLIPWNPSSRGEKINRVRNVLFFLTARLLRSWLALEFNPPFSLSKIIHPSIQPSSHPSIDAPLPGN
ncbi:hypothetical protein I7I48_10443 [Histoplasma ohiense]|nr:hypothetical protein I7I48_10443 [Histoplasma ohiense (nom. inval.)]